MYFLLQFSQKIAHKSQSLDGSVLTLTWPTSPQCACPNLLVSSEYRVTCDIVLGDHRGQTSVQIPTNSGQTCQFTAYSVCYYGYYEQTSSIISFSQSQIYNGECQRRHDVSKVSNWRFQDFLCTQKWSHRFLWLEVWLRWPREDFLVINIIWIEKLEIVNRHSQLSLNKDQTHHDLQIYFGPLWIVTVKWIVGRGRVLM